jgi:hypothetical protein
MRAQDVAETIIDLVVQTFASQRADVLLGAASTDMYDVVVLRPAFGEVR